MQKNILIILQIYNLISIFVLIKQEIFFTMNEKLIYMSFATQKGGAGKTPFTVLVASWLHYRLGYNVAVIDCDYPQNSLAGIRKRDVECVANSAQYKKMAIEQFRILEKKAYPVIGCDVQRALRWVTNGSEEVIDAAIDEMGFTDSLDVVLFDMPGTVNQSEVVDAETRRKQGVLSLVACMDYIFCPMRSDRTAVESTLMFIREVQGQIIEKKVGALQKFYLFWTEVDGREKTRIYDMVETVASKFEFPILKTRVPFMLRFKKESIDTSDVFKNTLFPAKVNLAKEARIDVFINEICEMISLPLK
jgi:cellulose biosynthesis protein BcsQ